MDQDFRLSYQGSSWVGKRGRSAAVLAELSGVQLTFANSTSFAFHDMCGIIRRSRSNVQWKRMYSEGIITLQDLNRRRATIGLSPLTAYYMRRFRVSFTPSALFRSLLTGTYVKVVVGVKAAHRPFMERNGASLYVCFL